MKYVVMDIEVFVCVCMWRWWMNDFFFLFCFLEGTLIHVLVSRHLVLKNSAKKRKHKKVLCVYKLHILLYPIHMFVSIFLHFFHVISIIHRHTTKITSFHIIIWTVFFFYYKICIMLMLTYKCSIRAFFLRSATTIILLLGWKSCVEI